MQRSPVLCSAAQFVSVLARPVETCLVSKRRKRSFEQHYETDTDNYCIYLHLYNGTISNDGVKGGRSLSGDDIAENYQPYLQASPIGFTRLYIGLPFIVYSSGPNLMFWKKKRALQAVVSR